MTCKIGYKSYVGFGEESSLGTAAQPSNFVEFNSESFQKEIEEKLVEAINGGRQYEKRVTLNESVSGSLEFPLVPGNILKILRNVSGSNPTPSTLATGVYSYAFVFNEVDTNTSLTFQVCRDTSDTASSYNYTGCRVNSASFNVGVNDLLNCSVEFMGIEQATADTITTASYRTHNPYTFVNGTIKLGDNKTAATATASFDSFQVQMANNLIEDRGIGSALRTCIQPGMQDITYELNARYEGNSITNRFLNGTKTYISAEFDSAVSIDATYFHKITIESYNCYFNGTVPNVGGASDILKQALPLRAIEEDASVGSMVITVVTDQDTI